MPSKTVSALACRTVKRCSVPPEETRICGYYALTLVELENRHLPDVWRKKLPCCIPGVRPGRLARATAILRSECSSWG